MAEEKVGQSPAIEETDPRAPKVAVQEEVTPEEEPVQEPTEDELPEQYRGKSAQEIARMHQEAEKVIGRQGQRLGEYKGILSPHVEFDDDGRVVAYKQSPEANKPPESRTEEDWEKLETETNLTKAQIDYLDKRFESKYGQRLTRELEPITTRLYQSDVDQAKNKLFSNPEEYPNAKDWEADIDKELAREAVQYRPFFTEEKYFIVAGRKSREAIKKGKSQQPKPEPITKKPYAEPASPARTEQEEVYDPIARSRADAIERDRLRGINIG